MITELCAVFNVVFSTAACLSHFVSRASLTSRSARVDLRGALAALACAAARRRRGVTPKGIKGARVLEAVEVTPVYRPLVWVERASTFAEGPEERAAAVLMLCEPETT